MSIDNTPEQIEGIRKLEAERLERCARVRMKYKKVVYVDHWKERGKKMDELKYS